jgi:hypothetical protein
MQIAGGITTVSRIFDTPAEFAGAVVVEVNFLALSCAGSGFIYETVPLTDSLSYNIPIRSG